MNDVIPDAVLERMAEKFRMLGDPTRLAILRVLMVGERSVGQISSETGQAQANVSKHLRMLADAGVVRRRKSGLHVFYAIGDPMIDSLCDLVCKSIMNEARDRVEKDAQLLEAWQGRKTPAPKKD